MTALPKSTIARYSAIAIAIIAAITLITRVVLASQEQGSIFLGISYLSQFFTILSNFLVLLIMVAIGLNKTFPKGMLEALVAAIVLVGVIYHVLLAHLWLPQGIAMLADQGVHTVVPVLTFIWWLVFSERRAMLWKDTFKVLVWPLLYVAYALIRAQWSGFYPYPFLNLAELGASGLALNVVGLLIVFYVVGLILFAISRYRSRATS